MSRRPLRRLTFQLKLLRQMRISLQKQFAFIFIDYQKMVNFLIVQNKCISHQFSKKAHIHQKITIDQLVFSVFSKIFERLLNKQLLEFFYDILSKFQCAFRKGYGTQYCLLLMLEIWIGDTDNNKAFGTLLTNFSKAFDC